MNQFDEFLKSFFNTEIYFLSNRSMQLQAWEGVNGDGYFAGFLVRFFERWATIVEYKEKFNFKNFQYNDIQKLVDRLENFQKKINYPTNSSEYLALIDNSEWQKIRMYADALYNSQKSE